MLAIPFLSQFFHPLHSPLHQHITIFLHSSIIPFPVRHSQLAKLHTSCLIVFNTRLINVSPPPGMGCLPASSPIRDRGPALHSLRCRRNMSQCFVDSSLMIYSYFLLCGKTRIYSVVLSKLSLHEYSGKSDDMTRQNTQVWWRSAQITVA